RRGPGPGLWGDGQRDAPRRRCQRDRSRRSRLPPGRLPQPAVTDPRRPGSADRGGERPVPKDLRGLRRLRDRGTARRRPGAPRRGTARRRPLLRVLGGVGDLLPAPRRRAHHLLPDRLPGAELRPPGVARAGPRPLAAPPLRLLRQLHPGRLPRPDRRPRPHRPRRAGRSPAGPPLRAAARRLWRDGAGDRRGGAMSEAEVTVIYWRDIPAQVMAGKGRRARRLPLPDRFQEAIDRAATRVGVIGADDYTAEYRKVTVPGPDPEVVADQLDADFPDVVLEELVRNGGWLPTRGADDD